MTSSNFADSLYSIPEKEIFTFVETYSMCDIYQGQDGKFLLGTERFNRFPKKYVDIASAKSAITKRYTAVNKIFVRNNEKQNPK